MNIIEIVEQDDGSAIIELNVTEEEKKMIIEVGFNHMLMLGMGDIDLKKL